MSYNRFLFNVNRGLNQRDSDITGGGDRMLNLFLDLLNKPLDVLLLFLPVHHIILLNDDLYLIKAVLVALNLTFSCPLITLLILGL
jgi:hypothetical protein